MRLNMSKDTVGILIIDTVKPKHPKPVKKCPCMMAPIFVKKKAIVVSFMAFCANVVLNGFHEKMNMRDSYFIADKMKNYEVVFSNF